MQPAKPLPLGRGEHNMRKPLAIDAERLSGELLGLTRGCDLRKEGVTVTSQANNPNNRIIDA